MKIINQLIDFQKYVGKNVKLKNHKGWNIGYVDRIKTNFYNYSYHLLIKPLTPITPKNSRLCNIIIVNIKNIEKKLEVIQ